MAIGGCVVLNPTPGASITIPIDVTARKCLAVWTASQAETVVISGIPQDGQELTLLITNDATSRVITMGTGLKSPGTLTGTINKKATISFIALGGVFYETGRAVGL